MKRVLSFVLSLVMILGLISVPAFASDLKTSGYDNLNNNAGDLVIGFLGGSITVADGDSNSMGFNRYATRVTKWFQDKYPAKTVKQVNAGIGGTGSDLGKYRVMTDIGAYAPDVVFVEYAVNDTHYSRLYSETVRSNMETIVRTLQSLPKVPVIVFLYSMHDDSYAKLNYTSIPDHQAVADYYDIETIDFYNYMKPLVEKGDFIWDKTKAGSLTNDNIHPNALGHEQYGKYIISQLESRDILHKNNYGIAPKFESTTVNTRDIKLDSATKSGIWEDSYSGQSDNKYEAIQSTATGDSITLTYTSAGNDSVGVTVLRGEGSYVLDEGTDSEISGTFSVSDSNLPVVKNFASGLSAGEHTVKIVNTADGTEVPHLKLGRLVAHGGREVLSATTAENGDHIPGSKPANLMQGSQTGNIIGTGNNGKVGYTEYKQDYTGNGSIYKFSATDTVTKGSWGGEGVNIRKLTEETQATSSGILYDGYTAKQDTYVFKTRVRALEGTPRVGSATTISWKPTYDNIYKGDGFIPGEEWEDYKTTLTSAGDGFTLCFGFSNAVAGDAFLVDFGDGVYYAPEEAYDVKVETTGTKNEVIAGGKNTYKAELLNQIEIPGTLSQEFTWSVVDAEGNGVEGLTATAGALSNEVTVNASSDVPYGTYYLKAKSDATSWQKTIAFTVAGAIENTDDHVKGELNDNIVNPNNPLKGQTAGAVAWSGENLPSDVTADMGTQYYTAFKTSSSAYTNSDYWGVGGSFMSDKNTSERFVPEENTTYVLEATVRSLSGEQCLNLVYTSGWDLAKTRYSNEYGSDGKKIGTEWETFKATVTTSTTSASANGILLGLRKTPANDYLVMNHTAGFYFAKEKAHDIKVTGASNAVSAGGTLNLEAEVLNQIGTKGALTQSFNWVAVTEDRTAYVEGITFTPSNDVANVTVNVADTVAPGNYLIVAQDKTYGMNRQYPITVTAPKYDVTELTVKTTSSSASVDAISVNATEDVMVVIAAYNGNRVVKASKTVITPVDGVATLSEADVQKLTLSELTSGNKVRVFVWGENLVPFTMKNVWKEAIEIK